METIRKTNRKKKGGGGGGDPFSCTVTKDLIHVRLAPTAITLSAVPRNLDKQLFTLRSLLSLRENRYFKELACRSMGLHTVL